MRKILLPALTLVILGTFPALADWDAGVAAFSAKNYEQAANEFRELVDQNPEGWRGHYMLGLCLQGLERKEEALQHLRKAYDLNPNELSIKIELGKAYFNVRRYGDVTKLLGPIDPGALPSAQQGVFYQIRGTARSKTNDTAGALKDYQQLVRLKPSDAQIQYAYATLALAADQMTTALDALKKAVTLDPKDVEKKRTYVQALVKQGRIGPKATKKSTYTEAAQLAGQLVAASPTYDHYMLKVSAELGAGLYKAAIETGKAALAKKNDDWLAHYYLGQAYTSDQQYEAAEQPLLTAKSKARQPDDVKRVWRQLGFNYEKQKKYSQSIEAYQFAGDQAAVTRVTENEKTERFNKQVEQENELIKQMEEEAKKLEEELKALEGGGGGL